MHAFFYEPIPFIKGIDHTLSADTSRHCIAVLRMQVGDRIFLVNGNGQKAEATIKLPHKQKCIVTITAIEEGTHRLPRLFIAIGFTKNRNRNEWLIEKVTEIGVDVIIPLQCQNSEREKFNAERATSIMVSAMIQSQQTFLPKLIGMMRPKQAIQWFKDQTEGKIIIAHCEEQDKNTMSQILNEEDTLILIGPEGDFASEEIDECMKSGAIPTTLGPHRLRTETAAIYACTVFNQKNYAQ